MAEMIIKTARVRLTVKNIGDRRVAGLASTFEDPQNYDSYGDVFAPGAFIESINKHLSGDRRVKLFRDHRHPIGMLKTLAETARGLEVDGRISKTQMGDDTLTLVEDDVLDAFSVGGFVRGSEISEERTEWGYRVRVITKFELFENSVVPWGANPNALIAKHREMMLKSARFMDGAGRPSTKSTDLLLEEITKARQAIALAQAAHIVRDVRKGLRG